MRNHSPQLPREAGPGTPRRETSRTGLREGTAGCPGRRPGSGFLEKDRGCGRAMSTHREREAALSVRARGTGLRAVRGSHAEAAGVNLYNMVISSLSPRSPGASLIAGRTLRRRRGPACSCLISGRPHPEAGHHQETLLRSVRPAQGVSHVQFPP